ncbi:helix-turn-helix domain-containing protein [Streptomyces sp. NPDC058424]|uniref:helix-turn-helix domain-containing protein n=1 Tax=Streptomyces sp. NPDC058424 TaxID=3346491 RepID=UPI00366575DC
MEDGGAVRASGGLPARSGGAAAARSAGREKATAGHVRVAADALGVSERTVWRWLAAAARRREGGEVLADDLAAAAVAAPGRRSPRARTSDSLMSGSPAREEWRP